MLKQKATEVMALENEIALSHIRLSRSIRIAMRHSKPYLVVEDDQKLADFLSVLIKSCGRTVKHLKSFREAVKMIKECGEEAFACAVVDVSTTEDEAEGFVDWAEKECPRLPLLIFTGQTEKAYSFQKRRPEVQVIVKEQSHIKSVMRAMGLPVNGRPAELAM